MKNDPGSTTYGGILTKIIQKQQLFDNAANSRIIFKLLYWENALALMLYTDTPTELCFLLDFRGQWDLGCSPIIDTGC